MQEARFYKNDEEKRGKNYVRKREIINLLFDESGTLNKLVFFPLFVQGTPYSKSTYEERLPSVDFIFAFKF